MKTIHILVIVRCSCPRCFQTPTLIVNNNRVTVIRVTAVLVGGVFTPTCAYSVVKSNDKLYRACCCYAVTVMRDGPRPRYTYICLTLHCFTHTARLKRKTLDHYTVVFFSKQALPPGRTRTHAQAIRTDGRNRLPLCVPRHVIGFYSVVSPTSPNFFVPTSSQVLKV